MNIAIDGSDVLPNDSYATNRRRGFGVRKKRRGASDSWIHNKRLLHKFTAGMRKFSHQENIQKIVEIGAIFPIFSKLR